MAPIGIAIIGGGIFAKEEHLPAVEKTDLLALKAVFSRSLKSAQELVGLAKKSTGVDLYSEDAGPGKAYSDLLARDDISAVILALPIGSQPKFIEAALDAGKDVLAEKPIAPDVASAQKLIEHWRRVQKDSGVSFSIAENFRFVNRFDYAAEKAKALGKITHFSVFIMGHMEDSNKYYKTSWRAKPEFQGGFLLDGGVHYAAAARHFLKGDEAVASVQALNAQAQEHLPPLDTINAVLSLRSGATGVFQHSCGTRINAWELVVGLDGGSVKVTPTAVVVGGKNGEEVESREFERTSGVSEEVAAWAEALRSGKADERQSPEAALADLEFLEQIFRSGEEGGALKKYQLQL